LPGACSTVRATAEACRSPVRSGRADGSRRAPLGAHRHEAFALTHLRGLGRRKRRRVPACLRIRRRVRTAVSPAQVPRGSGRQRGGDQHELAATFDRLERRPQPWVNALQGPRNRSALQFTSLIALRPAVAKRSHSSRKQDSRDRAATRPRVLSAKAIVWPGATVVAEQRLSSEDRPRRSSSTAGKQHSRSIHTVRLLGLREAGSESSRDDYRSVPRGRAGELRQPEACHGAPALLTERASRSCLGTGLVCAAE